VSSNFSGDKLSTLQYFITLSMQHAWCGSVKLRWTMVLIIALALVLAQCGPTDAADKIRKTAKSQQKFMANVSQILL
jgi:hypothetical protein